MRDSEYAEIYTSDSTMMTKYDKFLRKTRTARTGLCTGIIRDRKATWLPKPTEQSNGVNLSRSVIVKTGT